MPTTNVIYDDIEMKHNSPLQRIRRILHDQCGAELVEFTFAILLLLTILFAIMGTCLAMYSYHYVSYAAQEGARYAMVRGADWKTACSTSAPPNFTMGYKCAAASSDVQNYIRSQANPLIDPNQITVTTTWPATTPDCTSNCTTCAPANSMGCLVNVQVKYAFDFYMPFLPQSANLNFAGSSEKIIEE